jgi:hypothetical protein
MTKVWQSGLLAGLGGLSLAIASPAFAGQMTNQPPETSPAVASLPSVWQPASPEEEEAFWGIILNSPLGIAALNQLAIEGFVSPLCDRTLHTHSEFGSFQTLLQVQCPNPRGISIARSYSEVRITFNRFEDNIEDFAVERIYDE